ncbi:hypothetical protein COCON_G00050620 [Conger conger]|uniref:Uncharacterized protein n=1 Tax=Conger conger TaxID=82655 RepID=A0A9Q1DVL2_CONCO|nr:hypothetical protein COCON_G00050620 [Conger conger]
MPGRKASSVKISHKSHATPPHWSSGPSPASSGVPRATRIHIDGGSTPIMACNAQGHSSHASQLCVFFVSFGGNCKAPAGSPQPESRASSFSEGAQIKEIFFLQSGHRRVDSLENLDLRDSRNLKGFLQTKGNSNGCGSNSELAEAEHLLHYHPYWQ